MCEWVKSTRSIDKAFIGSIANTAVDSARNHFSELMEEFSIAARIRSRRIETSNGRLTEAEVSFHRR